MKFIPESDSLAAVNDSLRLSAVEGVIIGRLEAYSCKMIRDDKNNFKRFCGQAPQTEFEALSPPLTITGQPLYPSKKYKGMSPKLNLEVVQSMYGGKEPSDSVLGTSFNSTTSSVEDEDDCMEDHPEDRILRKTLFHLQSTLDASFYPHYDFSSTKASRFSREPSLASLQCSLGQRLNLLSLGQFTALEAPLWAAVDGAVGLSDCQIFSFNPEEGEDPFGAEGCVWALYYLFFNAALKRVLFLTLRQAPSSSLLQEDREMLEFRMDEDDEDQDF